MRALWAPWRMEFIRNCIEDKNEGCFLCEAVNKEEGGLVVSLTERAICVMNRYPYTNGHLLVAPRRHERDLDGLNSEELQEVMSLTIQAKKALEKTVSPHGFNIGMNLGEAAGAGLASHLHVHIVPRWRGDTNFMPVLADAKVIPQALDELIAQLKKNWPADREEERTSA